MKKVVQVLLIFPLICFVFLSAGVFAQTPAVTASQAPEVAPTQPLPTLAAALITAKPPDGIAVLAVAAAKVHLQDGYAPTHKDASLEQVAYAYGQLYSGPPCQDSGSAFFKV